MSNQSQPPDPLDDILNPPTEPGMSTPADGEAQQLSEASQQATEIAYSSRSEELIRHTTTPGEGTPELAEVMKELRDAPPLAEAQPHLDQLAQITGDDPSSLYEQYGRFLEQHQSDVDRGTYTDLNDLMHGDFWASTEQMAYGRVVGESLDMNPALASLLNPSGGLVGAGNVSVAFDADSTLGTHGIVHDAMGYMKTNVSPESGGIGPGYDYLGDGSDWASDNFGEANQGQLSGIEHWGSYDESTTLLKAKDYIDEKGKAFFEDDDDAPTEEMERPDVSQPGGEPEVIDFSSPLASIRDGLSRVRSNIS